MTYEKTNNKFPKFMNEYEKHNAGIEQYDKDIHKISRQDLVNQFIEEFHDSHLLNAEQNVPLEYKRVEEYLKVKLHKLLKEAAYAINLNLQNNVK